MEFWGIEIKPGTPFNVQVDYGYIIHVSQISIGESKKVGDETVQVYVTVYDDNLDEQKFLLGNLSQKIPQVSLDMMFDLDFKLSHECKNSSVYILGYKAPNPSDEQFDSDSDSEDEEIPMERFQSELEKPEANGVCDQKAELEAGESESDDEDESDSDEMDSDDDEDDSEEEEEALVKVEPPSKKKKPNGGAINNKTIASKKPKVAVSQKPSGGHKVHNCCGVLPPKRN